MNSYFVFFFLLTISYFLFYKKILSKKNSYKIFVFVPSFALEIDHNSDLEKLFFKIVNWFIENHENNLIMGCK